MNPELNKIYHGDALEVLKTFPSEYVNTCITSPPYWGLRDYGVDNQLGLENTPEEYVCKVVEIFREVKRVLRNDGTLWLNLGDSYNSSPSNNQGRGIENSGVGLREGARNLGRVKRDVAACKPKDLIGIPWMVAFALRNDGWYLRSDIIWHKPNPMPESVTDRPTKSHEYIFLLSKSPRYYYDAEAIKTKMECSEHDKRSRQGRKRFPTELINGIRNSTTEPREYANKRSVWTVTTKGFPEAHFATFPEELITDCIKAGCPKDGIVLDPFSGANTTGITARKLGRNYLAIELNEKYIKLAKDREEKELGLLI